MIRTMLTAFVLTFFSVFPALAGDGFEKDTFPTDKGDLEITFIGHGTLMVQFGGKVIHVDPWSKLTDYTKLPKADVILLTHHHQDHLDAQAISAVRTHTTAVALPPKCAETITDGIIMKNGDVETIMGIKVEAVPAYNLVHKRDDGNLYHPKGEGNGYVLTLGDKRVYIAGDTENTPEMKALPEIDIAFLPMNLPYTMTPEMVADAAKAFKPKVLYPYHFGETDTKALTKLMKDTKEVEVRIRKMP